MGTKRRFDSHKLVEGANPDLQSDIHVYAARVSQLHARLLAALDKLDTLRAKHDEDMAAEKRVGDVLTRRLERFQRYIKESRAEWDDTREALSIVIEKVELANDYSLWPHSQMCMTSPLEPLPDPKPGAPSKVTLGNSAQLYAKAVIASLREELEQERSAHAHTRAQAEADFLALSARLARREAELEEYHLTGAGLSRVDEEPGGAAEGKRKRRHERPPLARPIFSHGETIQILEVTDARNRELEAEVRHMRQSCDQARPSTPSKPGRHAEANDGCIDESKVADPLLSHRREDSHTMEVAASAAISGRTRVRSAPPDYHSSPTDALVPTLGFAQGQTTTVFKGSSADSDTLVSRGTALHQLQQLVDIFALQLDGFSAERNALKAALEAKEQTDDIRTPHEDSNTHGGDDECHRRLRETVHSLTHSLNELRASSQAREARLQSELDMMRLEVSRMASRESTTALVDPEATARVDAPHKGIPPWSIPGTPHKPPNILDDGDNECPMELATPLQPTIVSVRKDISDLGGAPSHPPSPSLVPLLPAPPAAPPAYDAPMIEQPSPQALLPSILLSSPLRDNPLWWLHPRSPEGISDVADPDMDAPRRMEIIERELLFARQELAAKNGELEEEELGGDRRGRPEGARSKLPAHLAEQRASHSLYDMPPRSSSSRSSGRGFQPAHDAATYRDLLLFENRLKTNVLSLNRRKHRYQLFLAQLLIIIAFLSSEVLLQTNLLSIPYMLLLRNVLPEVYGEVGDVSISPYFTTGLLLVSVMTLVLFFASGMYSEKIGYANRYAPHANRALRNLNMYLNVRQPPLRSKLPSFLNPFTLLFPRPTPSPSPSPPTIPARRRSPSPQASRTKRSSSVPIPPIPPASNPRGELIFSSRVDRSFRESYERYRTAFERRRGERERIEREKTWRGWVLSKLSWSSPPPMSPVVPPTSAVGSRLRTESRRSSHTSDSIPSSRRTSMPPSTLAP